MNHITMWRAWRSARARRRELEKAERERNAIIRAKETRRKEHRAFTYLDGDLKHATCRSLAATCGREWR